MRIIPWSAPGGYWLQDLRRARRPSPRWSGADLFSVRSVVGSRFGRILAEMGSVHALSNRTVADLPAETLADAGVVRVWGGTGGILIRRSTRRW